MVGSRIPHTDKARLEELAEDDDIDVGTLIRQIIHRYVVTHDSRECP
jgi:hypothetical protein